MTPLTRLTACYSLLTHHWWACKYCVLEIAFISATVLDTPCENKQRVMQCLGAMASLACWLQLHILPVYILFCLYVRYAAVVPETRTAAVQRSVLRNVCVICTQCSDCPLRGGSVFYLHHSHEIGAETISTGAERSAMLCQDLISSTDTSCTLDLMAANAFVMRLISYESYDMKSVLGHSSVTCREPVRTAHVNQVVIAHITCLYK